MIKTTDSLKVLGDTMTNRIEILHVAQTHRDALRTLDEHKANGGTGAARNLLDMVVQSQLKVAQLIKKHPNTPVVSESCGRTLSYPLTDEVSIQIHKKIKEIYSQGMPEKLESLTDVQKRLLYEYGAPFLLFFLGQIKTLYRSSNEDGEVANAMKHMSSVKDSDNYNELLDILDEPREKEAIQHAIEAIYLDDLKNNTTNLPNHQLLNRQVLLVYGSAHNFKRHCTKSYSSQYGQLDIAVQIIDCSSSNKMQEAPSAHSPDKSDETHLACIEKLTALLRDYKTHLETRPQNNDFIYQQKITGVNKLLSILAEKESPTQELIEKFKAELIHKETNNIPSIFEILNTRRFNVGFQDGSIALLKGVIVTLAYVTILPALLAWLITSKPTYGHFFTITGQDLTNTFQSMGVCSVTQTP